MPAVPFDADRNLFVYRFKKKTANFVDRTDAFQEFVTPMLALSHTKDVQHVHFRDSWGGIPVFKEF
jgi:hypothetical protein